MSAAHKVFASRIKIRAINSCTRVATKQFQQLCGELSTAEETVVLQEGKERERVKEASYAETTGCPVHCSATLYKNRSCINQNTRANLHSAMCTCSFDA